MKSINIIPGERMSIVEIFFSPSGTSQKVADLIADGFGQEKEICNLLIFKEEKELESNDVAVVVMPVFAGRIPKTARERLSRIKGNGTPAIAVANYGNAHVTDSLLELVDLLGENGFNVAAAASTVSHHSIFDGVAVGRPDDADIAKINEFSKKCIEKIKTGEGLTSEIPGNRPYTDYKKLPFTVSCDESVCAFCYDCVTVCPEHAIPEDDPVETDLDLCSRCTACISICAENARRFTGDAFESKKPVFEEANAERKEPEFYL